MQPTSVIVVSPPDLENIVEAVVRKVLREQTSFSAPAEAFLTLEQAATFLRMSKSALYAHTSQRKVPHIKRGRKLFFRLPELEAWILEGRKKTREEIARDSVTSHKARR